MTRIETESPDRIRQVPGVDAGNLSRQAVAQFEPLSQARSRSQEQPLDFGDVSRLYGQGAELGNGLNRERAALTQAANERFIDPAARREFEQSMTRFEASARERGLTQEQIAQTYAHLNQMLRADVAALPQAQRNNVAMQFLQHAADPSGIDQGMHGSCTAAALQERVFTRNPELAADMIASAAVRGRWTSTDGQVIQIDRRTLLPGPEERQLPTQDGERTQASQIFQIVALNDAMQHIHPDLRFTQRLTRNARPGDSDTPPDTGERVQFNDGRRLPDVNRPQIDFSGMRYSDLAALAARLGQRDAVVANSDIITQHPGMQGFNTQEQLRDLLGNAGRNRSFPLIIGVDANHPIFGMHDPSMTRMASHVVSITGFDPATGRVTISNQWGRNSDFQTDLSTLFEATFPYNQRPGQ